MANVDLGRYKRIVQLFWDPAPKNDDLSKAPIWCLGKQYAPNARSPDWPHASAKTARNLHTQTDDLPALHFPMTKDLSKDPKEPSGDQLRMESCEAEDTGAWPPNFLDDFESRFWFTYRSGFPPIKKSLDPTASSAMSLSVRLRSQLIDQGSFTSDTGWGCMIRSGQCLLANALGILRFGREFKHGIRTEDEQQLLALFADDPKAPFSIHNFVKHGASACGKHPGEWFGPSATARCIQALSQEYAPNELKVYLTGDGADVYEDSFLKLAKPDNNTFHPVLVLVGIRLGIDRITPVYWEALKQSVQLSQSVGIAGGRPSSSHYFVGAQGDSFFYLDPHQTRPALPLDENGRGYSLDEIDSYHTRRLRRLHIKNMDPSMLIAFLIPDEANWRSWRDAISQTQGKAVVHVADTEPALHGLTAERAGAIDEVETFDDEDEDG